MPQINVLPKHIAELIAAGEVVERPASVVKEVMENSIDAGADKITLEISRGGITYIRITDNGCGIDRENIRKAFISHATSKIAVESDLDAIRTLGFRGEALASVAAVARVEMMTRTSGEATGTRYVIEGGEEILLDDAGCPEGTTLVIRDIFYNTPARMKFLKKDVTEGNAVAAVVDRVALSHPEVSIRFIRDGKDALFTSGDGKLTSTIYNVLGRDFASTLIPARYELDGIKVSGFISKPFNSRPNRSMQYFFLNKRYIKTRTGIAALDEAYKNQIMVGKFPACVLNIEAHAGSVDVNVHPAKTEVRFSNEKQIFNAIYYCAKSALQEGDTRVQANLERKVQRQFMPRPVSGQQIKIYEQQLEKVKKDDFWGKTSAEEYRKETPSQEKTSYKSNDGSKLLFRDPTEYKPQSEKIDLIQKTTDKNNSDFSYIGHTGNPYSADCEKSEDEVTENLISSMSFKNEAATDKDSCEDSSEKVLNDGYKDADKADEAQEESDALSETNEGTEPFRVIGQAFKTYIIVEQGNKLLLIDKHAAHERILFEKFRAQRDTIETQLLLMPVTVTLSKEEYSAVLENLDLLEKAGYTVSDFGSGMVIVSECPTAVADADIGSVIMELAGYLADHHRELIPEKLDWIYHSTACRAAIKAGDTTTDYEMEIFVKNLLENPDIRYCPHGRPVLIEMSRYEIEKNFGRV